MYKYIYVLHYLLLSTIILMYEYPTKPEQVHPYTIYTYYYLSFTVLYLSFLRRCAYTLRMAPLIIRHFLFWYDASILCESIETLSLSSFSPLINSASPKTLPVSTHSIKFCNSRVFPYNYVVFKKIRLKLYHFWPFSFCRLFVISFLTKCSHNLTLHK